MEESTVSPSPASPTEGDDLCDIDVISVAIHSVTLLICLCGLAGNGAVIGLLSLKSCNKGILDLAVMDFLFLLFSVLSTVLFLVEDVSCSPIMHLMYVNFVFPLSVVSHYWALLWLMHSTKMLYKREIWNPCFCCILPECPWWVVDNANYWAFFALFTVIPSVTFLCPSQEQEHCQAALIFMYAVTLLLLAAPLLISSTIDFIKAKRGSQQQQQPKRRNIVIILIVLFTLLLSIWNFLQELGYIIVPSQVVFLLTCIHSSIKPLMYFFAGRCRRPFSMGSLQLSLQMVFEEPKEKTASRNDPAMDTAI